MMFSANSCVHWQLCLLLNFTIGISLLIAHFFMMNRQIPPKYPTHAIKKKDNWDGQGDVYYVFAYLKQGEYFDHDTNKPVLEYVGDEILQCWELN